MPKARFPLALFLVLGAFLAFDGSLWAQKEGIVGAWKGIVTEGNLTYLLVMKIERLEPQGYAGTTTYSGSVSCGGLLTFHRQRAGLYEFDETINIGNGCANGRIEAYITTDGRLQWEWYQRGQGGEPQARATLSPVP